MIPQFDIDVKGLEEQLGKLAQFDEISNRHLRRAMQESLLTVGSEVIPLVPVGVSARLKNSMGSNITETEPTLITGRFGSSLKDEIYPKVMEFGREPGKKQPPTEALLRWVHLKIQPGEKDEMRVAFLIARKIGRYGIKGKFFMKQGFEKARPRIVHFFELAKERILKDLENGR